MIFALLAFLGIGNNLFASEIFWTFSKEEINQEFLRAVGDYNVERALTLLMAGANPNARRLTDKTNAFMVAEWSDNQALRSTVMEFGGYLPTVVIQWRLLNGSLNMVDLKQFLTLSASKIRSMGGVIEGAEYHYLKSIVDMYKEHVKRNAQQQANQNHDDVERLIGHCAALGSQIRKQSS